MTNPRVEQYKKVKSDDLADRLYSKTYNNFAILVEKSYSPRFAEAVGDIGASILEEEKKSVGNTKIKQSRKASKLTENAFNTNLKKKDCLLVICRYY